MAYVAPHLRKKLLEEANAKNTVLSPLEIAKGQWESLSRSINRIVNKVNRTNFQTICTEELFQPNIIRGRGLLCKDILYASLETIISAGTIEMTPIYAALVAVINSQLPNIGYMFVARVLNRYDRRLRLDVDKTNAEKALKLLCWLANFYVFDFVNILELIRVLIPSSIPHFVELLTSEDTVNQPQTLAMIQMCCLGITAFQTCAQLIRSENQSIYESILNQFREIMQEIDFIQYDRLDKGKNNISNRNQPQVIQRGPTNDSQFARLRFLLESLIKSSSDNFASYSQFGDEPPPPTHDENGKPLSQPEIIEDTSLNLVPTEAQFTHQFDISDTKKINAMCDNNADWFKLDPNYDLNEARWAYIRDIILGDRDPLPDDGSELPSDAATIAIQLDTLDETSPYTAAFSTRRLTDSLQLRAPTEENTNQTMGFGGNTDINKVEIDPEVEAVQIRKSIYLIFQQSVTAEETVHRLLKTLRAQYNSPAKQSKYIRHIALTLYDAMLARGVYQKDDGAVGAMLCAKKRDFAIEFEDLFALTCADIVNKKERETHIIAAFFGDLLAQDSIDYTVFKYLTLQVHRDSLHDPIAISTRVFLTSLLKQLRKTLGEAKLLGILTHHELVKYTNSLFIFNTPKEFVAAASFYRTAGLPLFEVHVRQKQETHHFDAAKRDDNSSSSSSNSDSDSDDSTSSSDNDSGSDNYRTSSDSDNYHRNRSSNYRRRSYSSPSSSSGDYSDDSDRRDRRDRPYSSRKHSPPSSPRNRDRYRSNNRRDSSDSDDDRYYSRPDERRERREKNRRQDYSNSSDGSDSDRPRRRNSRSSRTPSPTRNRCDYSPLSRSPSVSRRSTIGRGDDNNINNYDEEHEDRLPQLEESTGATGPVKRSRQRRDDDNNNTDSSNDGNREQFQSRRRLNDDIDRDDKK